MSGEYACYVFEWVFCELYFRVEAFGASLMARPEVTGRKVAERKSIVPEGEQFYDRDLKVVLLPFVLDPKQAAYYIRCSLSQLYIMMDEKSKVRKQNGLPFISSRQIGSKRLIRREDLEKLGQKGTGTIGRGIKRRASARRPAGRSCTNPEGCGSEPR
jgi:hypothetical protein